jgi:hypothetical protein
VSALDESFTKLPHSLLTRALSIGLSGCEWDVLLLLVRFSYGFQKDDCSASLTRLANKCTHSRRQIGRALQRLCQFELIELYSEPTYRKAGMYSILDQGSIDAPLSGIDFSVAQTPQVHECHTERAFKGASKGLAQDTSATPRGMDATHSGIDATPEVTPAPLRVAPAPHIKDNRYKETLLKKSEKENGEKYTSIASGNATSLPFPKPLEAKSEKKKPDPTRLIKWFEEETRLKANVTESQMHEFTALLESCNERLFQVQFIKQMKKIAGVQIPEHLKGPGQVCMLIARAAAHEANGNGASA